MSAFALSSKAETDGNNLVPVLRDIRGDLRQFLDARHAPGCPPVDDNPLAAMLAEVEGLAFERRHLQRRRLRGVRVLDAQVISARQKQSAHLLADGPRRGRIIR